MSTARFPPRSTLNYKRKNCKYALAKYGGGFFVPRFSEIALSR